MFRIAVSTVLLALVLGCDDSGGPSSPTTTTTAPSFSISGSVTSYRFDLSFAGSAYGNVSYIVTNHASRAVSGCFVRVQWLDGSGLQVDYTYAATDASIPAGDSTFTDQHFMEAAQAQRITNSRVSYENCR